MAESADHCRSNAGNVAAENIVVPMINVMMTRVARRRDGANFKRRHAHDFVIFENFDAVSRHRRDLSPKPFHIVAENARGRFNDLRRINQMLGSARMHVNGGSRTARPPRTCKAPRRTGVIEMNVTLENVTNVFRVESRLPKIGNYIVES